MADSGYAGATKNATSYLQDMIEYASEQYTNLGGRATVAVPSALWMIDGLVIKPNVVLDFGDAYFKKIADGTGLSYGTTCSAAQSMLRTQESLVGGSTYYGNFDNIKIVGGTFDTNGKTIGSGVFCMLNCRDLVIEKTTIVRSETLGYWSYILGGEDVTLNDVRVFGGTVVGQDGIHFVHGRRLKVNGGYIESGDDAIAVGCDALGMLFDDEGISNVSAFNTAVYASRGAAVKVYYIPPSSGSNRHKVDGVYIRGVHGSSGVLRNGGVSIMDQSSSDLQDPSRVKNIDVECDLNVGSTSHDGVNPYGVYVTSGMDWRVAGVIRITDTTGGATRFQLGSISHSVRGRCEVNCPALPAGGGVTLFNQSTSVHWTSDNHIRGTLVGQDAQTVGHVVIANSIRTTVSANLLGIANSLPGIRFNTSSLAANTIFVTKSTFARLAGSPSATTGFDPIASGRVAFASITDCDFSAVDTPIPTSFNTNVTEYIVQNNRGINNRIGGVATVASGATSVTVTHGASPRLADNAEASLAQVRINPVGSLGSAAKWWVSLAGSPSDQNFVINTDVAPGGSGCKFSWQVDTGRKPVS